MPDDFGKRSHRTSMPPAVRRTSPWVLAFAAIVGVFVLGAVFWKMQNADDRTAINPQTTIGSRSAADRPALAPPAPESDPAAPKPVR